jgi:3'-phosphoadenosine 5'-phosphosulfate sulfotransferase (PAPS reductase)/FAD synthetase
MTEISDPFRIDGPAIVSFSGGRTSGYMLWRILQAYGGTLPDDVMVCFANTGREMPATLDFVRDCAAQWNVPIRWLEYRRQHDAHAYEVVNHNSASREGEPFEQMLAWMNVLPNVQARSCTTQLKIKTMRRYAMTHLGWLHWTNAVGLRADEMGRVHRAKLRRERWQLVCPLADAGIEEPDVLAFWRGQPFDLQTKHKAEGNCDGCFLKRRDAIGRMFLEHPDRMAWWVKQERVARERFGVCNASSFRIDREGYAEIADRVLRQGRLPFNVFEPDEGCTEWACTD